MMPTRNSANLRVSSRANMSFEERRPDMTDFMSQPPSQRRSTNQRPNYPSDGVSHRQKNRASTQIRARVSSSRFESDAPISYRTGSGYRVSDPSSMKTRAVNSDHGDNYQFGHEDHYDSPEEIDIDDQFKTPYANRATVKTQGSESHHFSSQNYNPEDGHNKNGKYKNSNQRPSQQTANEPELPPQPNHFEGTALPSGHSIFSHPELLAPPAGLPPTTNQ